MVDECINEQKMSELRHNYGSTNFRQFPTLHMQIMGKIMCHGIFGQNMLTLIKIDVIGHLIM